MVSVPWLGDLVLREVRVSHILVKADQEDKIESLAKELKAGGASAFAAMAAQHSTCPSGSNGGSLGWVKKVLLHAPQNNNDAHLPSRAHYNLSD